MMYCQSQRTGGTESVNNSSSSPASRSSIREGMRVVDIRGKALGTATQARYDAANGELAAFSVQHGLFGRKHKPVPAHLIKQVDDDVVTLKFSVAEFKELRDAEDRA